MALHPGSHDSQSTDAINSAAPMKARVRDDKNKVTNLGSAQKLAAFGSQEVGGANEQPQVHLPAGK